MTMNKPNNSKFVPALPDDNNINEFIPTVPDSKDNFYQGVAECAVNESDNLKNVKIKAKNLAQDNVQKKIADYIYGFLKDRLLTLPDDEILSVANEISNITDVKYNFIDSDDNLIVRATVTAQIDDNDIMNYIIKCFKERTELKLQNEALRKENEDLRRQIEEFRLQVLNSLANKKSREADKLYSKQDYTGAIKLYDEAIEINPNSAYAYHFRGLTNEVLREYEKAQADFKKAKELGW